MIGVTMGDSSGVGPEILLKTVNERTLQEPFVVYGDIAVLARASRELNIPTELRGIERLGDYAPDEINVVNHRLMREADVTPGKLNTLSGKASREYVISAAKAA